MSNKDYKEGMVAGAKPFGDKLDQLANVSESATSDIKEGLDSVNEVVNIVLDDLSAQEKKRIYDLDESTEVSVLEDDEKEFLVAVLTELANTIPSVTELQKRYIMSVCSIVGITPQASINLACIENINNMQSQKIILRHVMEFFFIGTQNYDFLEEYDEAVFSNFSVNKRGMNEIISAIDRIYNAMGIEGLANRYTFVAGYKEIIEDVVEEHQLSDPDIKTYEDFTVDMYNLENVILTDVFHINEGETIVYKYKKISISSIITVDGVLEFDHCIVNTYCDDLSAFFSVTGELKFSGCEITCRIDNQQHTDDKKLFLGKAVLNGVDSSAISFDNCVLKNTGHFISTAGKLSISGCTILNPGIRFISLSILNESIISNSIIEFSEGLYISTAPSDYIARDIIYVFSSQAGEKLSSFQIDNCRFSCSNDDVISGVTPINAANAPCKISNCEFFDFAKAQCVVFAKSLHKTHFKNCRGIIADTLINCTADQCSTIGQRNNSLIDNCDFNDCKYIVLPDNSIMKNCRIVNSQGRLINAKESRIEHCVFSNIKKTNKGIATSSLADQNFSIYLNDSSMDTCVFDGIDLKDNAFLMMSEKHPTSSKNAEITNCMFRNCYTDRSDKQIIIGREHYGILSPKTRSFTPINNCVGLDKVKCGTLEIECPMVDSPKDSGIIAGTLIGATFGIGGAVIGGIIGSTIDSMSEKNKR